MRLEPITDSHFEGLSRMNSEPEVMQYITGKPETPEGTLAMIALVKARWIEYGFSWWSFMDIDNNEVIGAGCIQYLGRDPANPLEIGWRLRKDKWNKGYASEAARVMAEFAFERLKAESLYAVCHQDNHASAHVMKKLGMQYRGIEHWYDMDTAVYSMDSATWLAEKPAT
ncbi:GNAT family N-acetyltransferase [Chitinimonas arctica]|uniref:GNAT family N-acetyltransferase n=1 Tax=Chitinimonas arctica TaxID=2594795 RepID=A0A516SCB7_9NEIS|nr:GNAT family N-acetyltransferase [Chitinimonas arctica]QDQ25792.1 GNAT family N-acetyltransferase [Chitinimonas arctica]